MEASAENLKSGQGEKMQEKETLDERLPGLFEPDTLLPIQYFEAMRKKHLLEGEKRLILSVLEDAIECFMTSPLDALAIGSFLLDKRALAA